MRDSEIIKNAECCGKGKCDECSMDIGAGCKEQLMKKLLGVARLQAREMRAIIDHKSQVVEENKKLYDMIRVDYDLKDLILAVNNIIYFAVRFDEKNHEVNPYDLVECMGSFLALVDKDHRVSVKIKRGVKNPYFEFEKE